MRIRRTQADQAPSLAMTPMIDIVFQLLTFFIMSLKIAAAEGDFHIKLPLAAPRPENTDDPPPHAFRLRMAANPDGSLKTLRLDERTLGSNLSSPDEAAGAFAALHHEILARIGDDRGPGSVAKTAEVEIDSDYNLSYEHVIGAITAVSGYVSPKDDKRVVRLIEKIKFAPPRARPAAGT